VEGSYTKSMCVWNLGPWNRSPGGKEWTSKERVRNTDTQLIGHYTNQSHPQPRLKLGEKQSIKVLNQPKGGEISISSAMSETNNGGSRGGKKGGEEEENRSLTHPIHRDEDI